MAARIGPNAVIQTLRAVEHREGTEVAAAIRVRSALPEDDLGSMVPEAWFASLVDAVRHALPSDRAEAALAESGSRTADYVAEHRIPGPIKLVLRALPSRLALPMLIDAFRKHAWTFAGAGQFDVEGRYPGVLTLRDAPTCRDPSSAHRGAYYAAAFEGLLKIADPRARVRETTCQASGDDRCRFVIELEPG